MAKVSTLAFDLRQEDALLHVGAIHDPEPHINNAHWKDLGLAEAKLLVKAKYDDQFNNEPSTRDTLRLLDVLAVTFNEEICRCGEAATTSVARVGGSCAGRGVRGNGVS